jgi:hypothetical protein
LVGGGFLVLAAVSHLRHHPERVLWLAAIGFVLVATGVVRPTWLGPIYRAWMALGHALSRVTTPILMGLIFFLVITPIGVLLRLAGRNPMPSGGTRRGHWLPRPQAKDPRAAMERQF